ncbi:MAG: hypothetical protein IT247_00130 [Bacteroidia bacterium]|nr:hypothetical protein [Bacteroidia bacterium]
MIKKISHLYSLTAVILLNAMLLFVALNIIAYFLIKPKGYDHYITTQYAMLKTNPALMQTIHEGKTLTDISDLYAKAPNIKSHPVLAFMTTPCSGKFYNVGFENARYNSFINASNIKQRSNGSTWMLGGSTTFGYGVSDNETFSCFLNQIDTTQHYINFGAPGYHQRMEIEKLIILLKKGYRPARVIFLEGLNDITQLISSNFESSETPNKPYSAYAQDFCVENLAINKNIFYALPVVRWWYSYVASNTVSTTENIYDEKALYNTKPYMHYKLTQLYEPAVDSLLFQKADQYYKENLTLLDALSKAYHFEYAVFFQPLGPMLDRNHFIADINNFKKEFLRYKAFRAIYYHVKQGIQQNKFQRFYDLSDAHETCKYPYVDLTHYSKSMHLELARQILAHDSIWIPRN